MKPPIMIRVDSLWWVSTLSITVMTTSGGRIASTLSTTEAIRMSRSVRRSSITILASQPTVNGAVSSVCPRSERISSASPDHTCDSRSSSTATGSSPEGAHGSRSQTTLRAASAVARIAAPPSLSNKITGDAVSTLSSWPHLSRTALAHKPPSRIHRTSVAGVGCSPRGTRSRSRSSSRWW